MSNPRPYDGEPPQGLPAQGGPSYPSSPGMTPVGPPPVPMEDYRGTPPPPSPGAGAPPGGPGSVPLATGATPAHASGPAPGGPMDGGPSDLASSSADTGPIAVPVDKPLSGSVTPGPPAHKHSRTGAAWVALVVAAIVLVFLLIFVVQNSDDVNVRFLGWAGSLPLGVAMLFAAVAGALLAGLLGTVRIFQLRTRAKRAAAAAGTTQM